MTQIKLLRQTSVSKGATELDFCCDQSRLLSIEPRDNVVTDQFPWDRFLNGANVFIKVSNSRTEKPNNKDG